MFYDLLKAVYHTGSMPSGTRSVIRRRSDGIHCAVLSNRHESSGSSWAEEIIDELDDVIDNSGVTWPTGCLDGIWVDFDHDSAGAGNFDNPFNTLDAGLSNTPEQARMPIKGGGTDWAGTINQRVELRVSLTPAVIAAASP